MQRLLLDDRIIAVQPALIRALDGRAAEAIVLQQLHYWLPHARSEHDGHRWVYNTYEQWADQTGLSPSQAKRAMGRLEARGLVVVSQPAGQDRTRWYRIDYDHEILAGDEPVPSVGRERPLQQTDPSDDSGSTETTQETTHKTSLSAVPSDPPNDWSQEVVELTREFAQAVRANGFPLPGKGTKAADGWLREFDRLLRIGPPGDTGGQPPPTVEEIRTVMAYAMSDVRDGSGFPGWGAVIRSAGKFREQYPRLALEARRTRRSGAALAEGYEAAAERLRSRR